MIQNAMEIKFTIHGNQENAAGNPIPYVRSTRYGQFNDNVARYNRWKDYVRHFYFEAMKIQHINVVVTDEDDDIALLKYADSPKPIRLAKARARMDLKIFWANGAHGDPDNVFKGIADALFANDKNLDGSFESGRADDGKGRVEVKIEIY